MLRRTLPRGFSRVGAGCVRPVSQIASLRVSCQNTALLGTEFRVLSSGYFLGREIQVGGRENDEASGCVGVWVGLLSLVLAVRQLTDSAGTTERWYRAFTGRPGPSGSWSCGRRENPERVDASADAPSGFLACGGWLCAAGFPDRFASSFLPEHCWAWLLAAGCWLLAAKCWIRVRRTWRFCLPKSAAPIRVRATLSGK